MLSATNLIAATAVAGLTGALLLAGPMTTQDQAEPAAPAAETDSTGVTLVSGEVEFLHEDYPGDTQSHDWGYTVSDRLWTVEFTMSDERLSGLARTLASANRDEWTWLWTESVYLENDGGAWTGTGYGYIDPPSTGGDLGAGTHIRIVLDGQGGYDGLTALLDIDEADSNAPTEVTGAIARIDMPQVPSAAPTTFE